MRLSLVGLAVVLVDQATKAWVSHALAPGESRTILPGLLHVTHVYNPGAAFGLFPSQQLLLTVIAGALLVYAWIKRRQIRRQSFAMRLGITLGLAGAAGNAVDRVWRGAVLDFIDVPMLPVFNVADTAIVIGVAVLFAVILFQPDGPGAADDRSVPSAAGSRADGATAGTDPAPGVQGRDGGR